MIPVHHPCIHTNRDTELVGNIEMEVCRDCYRVLSKRKVEP